MAAQLAHASLGAILQLMHKKNPCQFIPGQLQRHDFVTRTLTTDHGTPIEDWLSGSFTKICVSVDSEQELLNIHDKAQAAGLNVCLITDSGKTEFNGVPTITCLAIGPELSVDIDKITGHLKLL
jgi:PTH2 family peptidyl-tRNA hydrolase